MNALNLYDLAGWTIGIAGVALVLAGLFARRIVVRKTRRCARCGYELPEDKEPAAIRCSECGRVPKDGIELYTLRRWRMFLGLGLLACAGAVLVTRIPQIRVEGWASVLPTSVQIRMWEAGDNRLRQRIERQYRDGRLGVSEWNLLRQQVRKVLTAEQPNQNLVGQTRIYFAPYMTIPELLSENDLCEVLAGGSSSARLLALSSMTRKPAPASERLLELRRELVNDPDSHITRSAWEWMIRFPGGAEDLALIEDAIINAGDRNHWAMLNYFDEADPSVLGMLPGLLDGASARTTSRVIYTIEYVIQRHRGQTPLDPGLYKVMLAHVDSADARVRSNAVRALDRMPSSMQPEIEVLFRSPISDDIMHDLIHQFRRMDEWCTTMLPAVHSIAEDQTRSIGLRLDAHDACLYIQRRYRTGEVPTAVPIYIDALENMDLTSHRGAVELGRLIPEVEEPAMLAAIAILLDRSGADDPAGVQRWLDERPALLGLMAVTDGESPASGAAEMGGAEQLGLLMEQAWDDAGLDPEIAEALERGLGVLSVDGGGGSVPATSP